MIESLRAGDLITKRRKSIADGKWYNRFFIVLELEDMTGYFNSPHPVLHAIVLREGATKPIEIALGDWEFIQR